MEPAERERLRSHLIGMIQVIAQTAVQREEGPPADDADAPQHLAKKELRARSIESDFQTMQSIREALQRMEEGTYGRCLFCDRAISAQRLEAKPWASCCDACEEEAEREHRKPAEEWCLPGHMKAMV